MFPLNFFLKAINPPRYRTSNISNTSRWVDFQSWSL